MKKIIIIGGGPGGLAAGMLLAAEGYNVKLFEKQPYIGGRTSSFSLGAFTFDLGPTILTMPHVLQDIFKSASRRLCDYVNLKEIDPLYTLYFKDFIFQPKKGEVELERQIEEQFPGEGKQFQKFMRDNRKKLNRLLPILENKHDTLSDYMRWRSFRALPEIEMGRSLYEVVSRYFHAEPLRYAFSFHAKYLGMSPWECPGLFSILPFLEHEFGIYHPVGGVNQITKAMADVIAEWGGEVHVNCGVNKILVEGKQAYGVELDNGEKIYGDEVIMNADFAYGMMTLLIEEKRAKYKDSQLAKKKHSCSTFMIYAGLNRELPLGHHNYFFSPNLRKNMVEISQTMEVPKEPSIYMQHASVTDETLAPKGKSTLYILVPVPNNCSNIDWNQEKDSFRQLIWSIIEKQTGIVGLQNELEVEKIITPFDWEQNHFIYEGANFSLSHYLSQLLYFRPHNDFEEIRHLWLVGGGTHPGTGIPPILESAKITTKLIMQSHEKNNK